MHHKRPACTAGQPEKSWLYLVEVIWVRTDRCGDETQTGDVFLDRHARNDWRGYGGTLSPPPSLSDVERSQIMDYIASSVGALRSHETGDQAIGDGTTTLRKSTSSICRTTVSLAAQASKVQVYRSCPAEFNFWLDGVSAPCFSLVLGRRACCRQGWRNGTARCPIFFEHARHAAMDVLRVIARFPLRPPSGPTI